MITKDESELIPDLLVRQSAAPKTPWKLAPVPILVVEVLSPTTRRRDHEYKRPYYIEEVGVLEYWIADGDRRSIAVIRAGLSPVVILDRLTWALPGVNASLEVELDSVFCPL